MYQAESARRGLAPTNLSRGISDAGSATGALVPWNICGAFPSATLGVATLVCLRCSVFNLCIPLTSILLGSNGFRVKRIDEPVASPVAAGAEVD